MQPVRGEIYGMTPDGSARGFTNHEIPDTLALFCWLHKDGLLAKIDAEIDLLRDDDNALTDEQRAQRITALREQLLVAERIEEALVGASEIPVLRRTDADPRAVLSLSSALPAPR
jgi:hypothetical protein